MTRQDESINCHWCGRRCTVNIKFYPACSEDHLARLRGEVEQTVYSPPVAKEAQIKLWVKYINHSYAAWSALFELITGFKPPRMKDVAALISGKN